MSDAAHSPPDMIYDRGLECLKLFQDCLATEDALAVLQPYEERFWAWANQLKVFSKPHISLDAQLKHDKFDRLRQAVYLLLDVLRDNLQLALKLSQKDAIQAPKDENGASDTASTPNPLEVPLSGIERSLKRLDRVAIVILQATESSLARRILDYADQVRNESYEEEVDLVLRYRFQNALPEELRRLIYTSVLHRYYRIQYERKRRTQEQPRWEVIAPEPVPEPAPDPEQRTIAPQQAATLNQHVVHQPQRHEVRSEAPTQPLTVDADIVKEKLKDGLSSPPSYKPVDTASVSETGDALYPKAPEIKEGQSKAKCPICLKDYEADTFEGAKWRLHVNTDIRPYVCVSAGCSRNLCFFVDRKSWSLHMQTEHTALWIKHLPNRVWRCPLPHAVVETFLSEEDLLQNHLRTAHTSLPEQTLKSIAHNGSITHPRRVDICPICGDEHRPQNRQVDQRGQHGEDPNFDTESTEKQAPKATAKPRVHFAVNDDATHQTKAKKGTEGNPPTSNDTADRSSPEAVAHKRMERYVGKHLKALAFFFARNFIEEEDGDEDTSAARARSMDDLKSVGLSDFSDLAEPPHRDGDIDPDDGHPPDNIPDSEEDVNWNDVHSYSEGPVEDQFLEKLIISGAFQSHLGEGALRAIEDSVQMSKEDREWLRDFSTTDPRFDKLRIEETKGGLLRDSYRWILDNVDFQRWLVDGEGRLLWIAGDPGMGKTMLLCGIINELSRMAAASDRHSAHLAYFFCQANDSRINNAKAVLRGLIYMLVGQQPSLVSHLRKKYNHAGRALFKDANAWVALAEIFTNILQDPNLNTTYVIIDALDECVTDLPKLLSFIVKQSSASSRVKWIVSSRNWPTIEEQLERAEYKRLSLELNAESVAASVTVFI